MEPEPLASAPRRVEAYLDQILAPLTRSLSPFHWEELRRELREHLWARVDAYRRLGQSEDAAVTEALRQFGGAEDFLRQWHREWMKTTPQATLREVWQATRFALLLSLPALLITCIGSHEWSRMVYADEIAWVPDWLRACGFSSVASGWGSFALDFIALPLALGVAAGRLMPRYAGLGMLVALAIEVVAANWFSFTATAPNLGFFASRSFDHIFMCSTSWLPLACTSAALTGWWVQRSQAHRLA